MPAKSSAPSCVPRSSPTAHGAAKSYAASGQGGFGSWRGVVDFGDQTKEDEDGKDDPHDITMALAPPQVNMHHLCLGELLRREAGISGSRIVGGPGNKC